MHVVRIKNHKYKQCVESNKGNTTRQQLDQPINKYVSTLLQLSLGVHGHWSRIPHGQQTPKPSDAQVPNCKTA